MNIKNYVKQKLNKPRDIYETNHMVLMALKYWGALPIDYDIKNSRQIRLSKPGLIVSFLLTLAYIYGIVDQLGYKTSYQIEYDNIDKSILYLSMLIPFYAGLVSLLVLYGSSAMSINTINYCFARLFKMDFKIIEADVNLMNKDLLKNHIFLSVFSGINTTAMFSYFAFMNIKNSGLKGFVTCLLYIMPYIYVNILLYLYITIVFMLTQRFNYIYKYLISIIINIK